MAFVQTLQLQFQRQEDYQIQSPDHVLTALFGEPVPLQSSKPRHLDLSPISWRNVPDIAIRMDAPVKPNARRLTKETAPSSLKENMSSSRSLRSQNSGTLRRNPSAPTYPQLSPRNPGDNPRTQSTYTSSNSSLERPSPSVASSEFGSQGQSSPYNLSHQYTRRSLIERSSDELIGTTFDAPGSSKTVDHTKASGYQNSLRRPGPPPLSHTSPDPRMLTTPLRQSASFSSGDRTIETTPTRTDSGFSISKRYSDESKARWRKKSGISQIFNSVLGSSRNVKISAPENPIHVTHVGYDNETGQFTVRFVC